MSLEEALNRNSDLLETHNDLLTKLVGMAASKATATTTAAASTTAAETAEKPKVTRAKAADKPKELTLDDVKPGLAAWLNEFPKDGDNDHPETTARKEALKAQFAVMGAANLKEVTTAEGFATLQKWLDDTKAKGRLVEDAPAGEDGDDMLG